MTKLQQLKKVGYTAKTIKEYASQEHLPLRDAVKKLFEHEKKTMAKQGSMWEEELKLENVQQGFYKDGVFHPIRASKDYDEGRAYSGGLARERATMEREAMQSIRGRSGGSIYKDKRKARAPLTYRQREDFAKQMYDARMEKRRYAGRNPMKHAMSSEIASTILRQIGPNYLSRWGARMMMAIKNGVQFKAGRSITVVIQLTPSDTYDLSFYRGAKKLKALEGLYADGLAEAIDYNIEQGGLKGRNPFITFSNPYRLGGGSPTRRAKLKRYIRRHRSGFQKGMRGARQATFEGGLRLLEHDVRKMKKIKPWLKDNPDKAQKIAELEMVMAGQLMKADQSTSKTDWRKWVGAATQTGIQIRKLKFPGKSKNPMKKRKAVTCSRCGGYPFQHGHKFEGSGKACSKCHKPRKFHKNHKYSSPKKGKNPTFRRYHPMNKAHMRRVLIKHQLARKGVKIPHRAKLDLGALRKIRAGNPGGFQRYGNFYIQRTHSGRFQILTNEGLHHHGAPSFATRGAAWAWIDSLNKGERGVKKIRGRHARGYRRANPAKGRGTGSRSIAAKVVRRLRKAAGGRYPARSLRRFTSGVKRKLGINPPGMRKVYDRLVSIITNKETFKPRVKTSIYGDSRSRNRLYLRGERWSPKMEGLQVKQIEATGNTTPGVNPKQEYYHPFTNSARLVRTASGGVAIEGSRALWTPKDAV